MDAETVTAWLARYERAWRSPGTDQLAGVFADDARYLEEPYAQPRVGLAAIAQMWDTKRDGPAEAFTMTSEVVAVDGATAVVRVGVRYEKPADGQWRDLWVLRFAPDGRCAHFEEWPFSAQGGQYRAQPG
jgi:ketosteroid isomerase-like protein